MEQKPITVRREGKWDPQHLSIGKSLLHPIADRVLVVLGLNDRNWNVGLDVKHVVSALSFAASDHLTTDDYPAIGEGFLLGDLCLQVPTRFQDRRRDELATDISLRELAFFHFHQPDPLSLP